MESSRRNEPSPHRDMMVFGVVLFLFFASYASLFGVTIWELTKKEPEQNLLFLGDEETQLQITNSWKDLYSFYTKNIDRNSKPYSGEYRVVMNNSSGVDFRVVDENGVVMGTTVERGGNYVETIIPFNSGGRNVSQIILQYQSTHNAVVTRISIEIN